MEGLTKLPDEQFEDEQGVTWIKEVWVDENGIVRIENCHRQ